MIDLKQLEKLYSSLTIEQLENMKQSFENQLDNINNEISRRGNK